jgi:signal recognition particle subunit SRP68
MVPPHPIVVSQLIKASQSQNGLKHADYGRYRRYCVHKVKRIRKTMKFSYGKKYHTLDITKERQNDPKLLHVLLYNAERHWSYAMALKSQMTSEV